MATDVQLENATSKTSRSRAQRPSSQDPTPSPMRSVRRPTWWKRLVIGVCLVAVLATSGYVLSNHLSPEKVQVYLTHKIARRDLKVSVTEQGRLESSNNTEVRCKVKGANSTLVWIVENGTMVKPGDILVRIDTSTIEDNINTQEIAYQNALATFAQSESDLAVARINITEYLEGLYRSELKTKEKDVAIAKANLRSAQNMLNHAKEMYRKGFMSKLELEGNEYSLQQAQLELEVKQTDVDVLQQYTKAKQVKDLEGILAAKEAKLASDEAALRLEKAKLDREKKQLENCVIRSDCSGMVIYRKGEEWEDRPDIREGATVREDQVLLLIPDLTSMQIKVGIHEALIERVKPGLQARIELQDKVTTGEVLSVAPMAERAGWWNGNMVKYATTIKLDSQANFKPGMSANVEVYLAEHKNVVTIPVAAVVEHEDRFYCWVWTGSEPQRRELILGDSDDQFLVVHSGVTLGEEVIINPIAEVDEAQDQVLKPFSGVRSAPKDKTQKDKDSTPADSTPEDKLEEAADDPQDESDEGSSTERVMESNA